MAIFASAFYPNVGGVEELCRQLAHAYQQLGHGVVVLTNRWPRSLPAFGLYEAVPVYRLAMRVPEGSLKARVNYVLTHRAIRRQMFNIVRRHKADLLHVQCVSSNGYYALLARWELKLPLVVTAQGERTMDAGGLYKKSAFANAVLKALLSEADWVTACSRDTLQDLEQYRGQSFDGRGSVVYNGIRLSDFEGVAAYRHGRPFILGIGRMVLQKGFDVLVRAFALSGVNTHDLLLAGEGPEQERLRSLVVELGLEERVHLLGRADRQNAVALFKGCDLFVLPSRMEPMGIVNLEAMAAAKAVVASRVGGVPELMEDGVTGVFVPPEDVAALAGAMRSLLQDPARREQMGAAGHKKVKAFDWSSIAGQYLDIYHRITSRQKAAEAHVG